MSTEPSGIFVAAEEVIALLRSSPEDQQYAINSLLEFLAEVQPSASLQ